MKCCRAFDPRAALTETGPSKKSIAAISTRISDIDEDSKPTLLFQRAMLHIAAGCAEAARDDAVLIDKLLPGTPHTIYIRARTLEIDGDSTAAIEALGAASELLMLRHPPKASEVVENVSRQLGGTGMSILARLWRRSEPSSPVEPVCDNDESPCEFLKHEIDGRATVLRLGLPVGATSDDLYIRQMIPGRDICCGSPGWFAGPSARLAFAFSRGLRDLPVVYAIGSRASKACVLVNAAWDPEGVLSVVKRDGMRPIAVAITSARIEHTGGKPDDSMPAFVEARARVRGLKRLIKKPQLKRAPVYAHPLDANQILNLASIDPRRIRTVHDGESIILANSEYSMRFVHTPGTTPGAMCIVVERELNTMAPSAQYLISGDTLLLPPGNSGRMDHAGADTQMHQHSVQKLASLLPGNTIVLPGRIAAASPLLSGALRQFLQST